MPRAIEFMDSHGSMHHACGYPLFGSLHFERHPSAERRVALTCCPEVTSVQCMVTQSHRSEDNACPTSVPSRNVKIRN